VRLRLAKLLLHTSLLYLFLYLLRECESLLLCLFWRERGEEALHDERMRQSKKKAPILVGKRSFAKTMGTTTVQSQQKLLYERSITLEIAFFKSVHSIRGCTVPYVRELNEHN
jgi:hypothetical protein